MAQPLRVGKGCATQRAKVLRVLVAAPRKRRKPIRAHQAFELVELVRQHHIASEPLLVGILGARSYRCSVGLALLEVPRQFGDPRLWPPNRDLIPAGS